ncbi:Hsp20/alpha crystallin family protein [Candidatus Kaiserbacteria bacterium]|nr:Hsp20/alpha crystallin family protein [Candidatus Kaiserbacteria bacterium]USN92632.1 MAG: Hsp20/alpha crystallin family protein [Candidatus Nomurabacteria bacterium]
MSLIKWEPFEEFDRVFRDMSTLPSLKMSNMNFDLACDVYEDGDNLVAEMNLPGLDADSIDVEIEENHLRVSGKREEIQEKKEKNHYTKEIKRGSFERLVPLPNPVKKDAVEAEYSEGVLKVTMPKREASEDKRIKVKVKK